MNECIPEVVKAMPTCSKESVQGKLFSASITNETFDRSTYILSQFGPLLEICTLLVDGYVASDTAVTQQFSRDHRVGHGSVTSPTQRGYAATPPLCARRSPLGARGIPTESFVQAPFIWASNASAAAFVGANLEESGMARQALDQSSRHTDSSLDEETLIRKLVCVVFWIRRRRRQWPQRVVGDSNG
ncbi:rbcL [Symbiodinium sp. CCMP2456]|nr:rbcL [Symbiodinium sp. CCMP2456]